MPNDLVMYTRRDSLAQRMDPRWKLAAAVLCGLAILCLQALPAAAAALLATFLLLAVSRIPWGWYLRRLGGVALFLVLFWILLPLTLPGETWLLGPLALSKHGVTLATLITLKTLAFVSLVLLLIATSPFEVTLQAAHALHVPGLVVQLLMFTYRYIFLFGDELGKLRVALRVRAYRNRASAHAYRTIGNVTGTLLVRSDERAERVAQAMRCRGFDGRFRTLHQFHTRPGDVLKFAVAVALLPAAVALAGLLPLPLEWGPWLLGGESP